MTTHRTPATVSRRTALAGLGAGSLSLIAHPALARKATDMATHPLVGTWISGSGPNDLTLNHWGADGSVSLQSSTYPVEVDGVLTYNDSVFGVWEPTTERGAHITFTWITRDATGAALSSTTVDGYPVASEDGMSFIDEGTQVVVTVRDPWARLSRCSTVCRGSSVSVYSRATQATKRCLR